MAAALAPRLASNRFVTDGGMETDLIFHHGVDLPEFAAYPLLDDAAGRELLAGYYDGYARVAAKAGAGLVLETPTWRANPDWGARLGHDADALAGTNRLAVELMHATADRWRGELPDVLISGAVGPRHDGYRADATTGADEAADYHRAQLAAFADAGADLATCYTMTHVAEAVGVVRAARSVGLPVAVAFTVETDGTLPDGTPLAEAIAEVDATDPPEHFLVNCAYPTHVARGLATDVGPSTLGRIAGLRCNASTRSHAELDEAEELDGGDPVAFAADHGPLLPRLTGLQILGGCCGTDVRHVAALWGVA